MRGWKYWIQTSSKTSCPALVKSRLPLNEDCVKQVEPKLSSLAYCPLTTYKSRHCLTQLCVTWDWFNSIPQWQRTKCWTPANHYSHWKNTLVWYYYLRRNSIWFCAYVAKSGMNLVWIHSINDVGKLQKLLPFESYEVKCKG